MSEELLEVSCEQYEKELESLNEVKEEVNNLLSHRKALKSLNWMFYACINCYCNSQYLMLYK